MRVAIFSDSHDNLPNVEKFIAFVTQERIDALIFCGDLCAPATLAQVIAPRFSGSIHMVFGNVTDRNLLPHVAAQFSHVTHYGDIARFRLADLSIGVVHFPEAAKELARSGKFDFVFYGHTHTPWEETIGRCRVVNPGTLAGMFSKATFALLETAPRRLTLKLLETV